MKLNVSIEYRTKWGEGIVLCLGTECYPLLYATDGLWTGELTGVKPAALTEYSYMVVCDGVTTNTEWKKHSLVLPKGVEPEVVNLFDRWNERPADAPFYSSAFTKAILGRKAEKVKKAPEGANVLLKVAAPVLRPNEVRALAGSGKALKDWTKIVPFDATDFPRWTLSL